MNRCKWFSKIWFLGLLLVAFVAGCANNGGDPGTLVSLKLTPATASIPVTGTVQYTTLALFGDGSARDVTGSAVYTAGTTGVTFGAIKGLATGAIANAVPVVITASYSGKSATAALTVNSSTSIGLRLSPETASIPVTGNQQYTLLEIFSDGTSQLRTTDPTTTWSTLNNTGNASLTPSGPTAGLATGLIATPAGTPVTVRATYNGTTVTAALTVNAATSRGLILSPAVASIPVTGNQQYTLLEIFSDGTTQTRTADLATAWSMVNNAGNVSLTPSGPTAGLARGLIATPAGTPVTIRATYNGTTVTAALTVNAATSMGLSFTPAVASIPVTGTQQYVLLEVFSDGTTQPRTTDLATTWSTLNNAGNVSLTPSGPTAGLATGLIGTPPGTPVTVRATYNGITMTASLTVSAVTTTKFEVIPATASITISGGSQQFAAIETFSDGSTADRTLLSTWSSVDLTGGPGVSTIGLNTGIATGAAIGTSTITATYTVGIVTQTDSAILTVTAPNPGTAGAAADLGMAATYGIIATNAITSSSVTAHVFGDVALTTGVMSSVTGPGLKDLGVAPHLAGSGLTDSNGVTPGEVNTADNGNLSIAQLIQLQSDLNAAYIDLSGRPAGTIYPAGAYDLSGQVLIPGVYEVGASAASDTFALSTTAGPLILDAAGNPDAVFIFKAGTMTTTTGSVVLQNGAQPKNIFWVIASDATIGDGTSTFFQGTVVAGNTITVGLNSNVQGRMLAGALGAGSITNSGVITVPK